MDHMPRLHPDDLQELGDIISLNLSKDLSQLLGRNETISKATTFSIKEVAKIVNKHPTTVLNHITKKILKASKPGKDWIITQDALNQYINGK